jgi:hypothetical protein
VRSRNHAIVPDLNGQEAGACGMAPRRGSGYDEHSRNCGLDSARVKPEASTIKYTRTGTAAECSGLTLEKFEITLISLSGVAAVQKIEGGLP